MSQPENASAALSTELSVRPWRDGLDDEIAAESDYEGLPCAECGQIAYPENYECACPR